LFRMNSPPLDAENNVLFDVGAVRTLFVWPVSAFGL